MATLPDKCITRLTLACLRCMYFIIQLEISGFCVFDSEVRITDFQIRLFIYLFYELAQGSV